MTLELQDGGRLRRQHRKSRRGCAECKRRHKKCDETHPACVNCSNADLPCSFAVLLSSAAPLSTKNSPLAQSPSISTSPSSTPAVTAEPQLFDLNHLELLHHLETDFPRAIDSQTTRGEGIISLVIKCALVTPYLMDQALAVASLHLSTLHPERREFYRHQATQLQTRALALFNAVGIEGTNSLEIFLFSSLLGQEVMYEAFTARNDFHTFIEGFADCLSLHRGIRAVAGSSWSSIEAQIKSILGDGYPMDPPAQSNGHECDVLVALIGSTDLSDASKSVIRRAVESLQWAFDIQRNQDCHSWQLINAAMAWPVVVPAEFATLIKQRQPEALITVSYYAVILYRARDFWVFGDVGLFIIRSITMYLGLQWEGWLAWPTELLRRASKPDF